MKESIQSVIEFLNTEYNIGANSGYIIIILSFITVLSAIIAGIYKFFILMRKYVVSRATARQIPYFTNLEVYNALRYYISTNCQNVAPGNSDEPGNSFAFSTKEKLIPFFLNKVFLNEKNDSKYYIILAESGMGKTTFLINLYVRYKNSVLYRLKTIFKYKHKIIFIPLADSECISKIRAVDESEQADTILLLDAFDEDAKANKNYKQRLDQVIDATKKYKYVIITCRTQFFPSEDEEPSRTGQVKFGGEKGFHEFKKMYLSPFDKKDTNKYINKKYPIWRFLTKAKARKIIKKSPNLLVRPMLLNYLDDLIKSNKEYKYTYQIYEHLIDKWLDRESKHKNNSEYHKKNLFEFSLDIALHIYNNRLKGNSNTIEKEEIERYAEIKSIELEKMEMTSRSLLNRNASGQYKFAHKSIYEYFLAYYLFKNPMYIKKLQFTGLDNFRLFISEMCFKEHSNSTLPIIYVSYSDEVIYFSELNNMSYVDTKKVKTFFLIGLNTEDSYAPDYISVEDEMRIVLLFSNAVIFKSNYKEIMVRDFYDFDLLPHESNITTTNHNEIEEKYAAAEQIINTHFIHPNRTEINLERQYKFKIEQKIKSKPSIAISDILGLAAKDNLIQEETLNRLSNDFIFYIYKETIKYYKYTN